MNKEYGVIDWPNDDCNKCKIYKGAWKAQSKSNKEATDIMVEQNKLIAEYKSIIAQQGKIIKQLTDK